MSIDFKAIEISGEIDEQHQLHIDARFPNAAPGPVRILVLIPETDDISEAQWLRAAAASPAFDFLKDAAEDVYSLTDGKPFHDQG